MNLAADSKVITKNENTQDPQQTEVTFESLKNSFVRDVLVYHVKAYKNELIIKGCRKLRTKALDGYDHYFAYEPIMEELGETFKLGVNPFDLTYIEFLK